MNCVMDKMVEKLLKEELEFRKEEIIEESEDVVLSPKIDVDKLLRGGAITLDDYRKTHSIK